MTKEKSKETSWRIFTRREILINILLFACFSFYQIGCSKNDANDNEIPGYSKAVLNNETPAQLDLPPNLLSVLQKEMLQIESGMQLLLNYLSRGEAQNAAHIAMQIHDSFILKQSLTPEELQHLVSLLPTGFVHLDRAFHGNAKKLAETVQRHDFLNSMKIYGDMAQACVSCHSQYAPEKFPGFSNRFQNR